MARINYQYQRSQPTRACRRQNQPECDCNRPTTRERPMCSHYNKSSILILEQFTSIAEATYIRLRLTYADRKSLFILLTCSNRLCAAYTGFLAVSPGPEMRPHLKPSSVSPAPETRLKCVMKNPILLLFDH